MAKQIKIQRSYVHNSKTILLENPGCRGFEDFLKFATIPEQPRLSSSIHLEDMIKQT